MPIIEPLTKTEVRSGLNKIVTKLDDYNLRLAAHTSKCNVCLDFFDEASKKAVKHYEETVKSN